MPPKKGKRKAAEPKEKKEKKAKKTKEVEPEAEADGGSVSKAKDGAEWWEEPICAGVYLKAKMKKGCKVASFKSKFQDVKVFETETFGKCLVLDGYTQSAQRDEFIYHESLAHPALFCHPNPKTVFIGGGGEMATAREVLRHKSVERLVMVDIDEEVVDICRKELPEWGGPEADKDPRLVCVYDDAKKYLEETKEKFDVVIMDIADPIMAGPGIMLYTTDFYQNLKSKLNPGFVFVTQSGPCGLWTHKECFSTINNTLRQSFEVVAPYSSFMPAFADFWGFNLAYDKHPSLPEDLPGLCIKAVDAKIKDRLKDGNVLKYYDGVGHRNIFNVPKYVREGVAAETRVMSKDNLVFMDSSYRPVGFTDSHGKSLGDGEKEE